jgi:uncharacterized protein with von Willebrand factor type A (vWA) domain
LLFTGSRILFSNYISFSCPLTDIKNNLDKLIAFLSMSFHGGVGAASAMKEALRMLEAEDYKKAL